MKPLLPGSTIGILGGGQLARMYILAGRCLGYRFVVFDTNAECPSAAIADKLIASDYLDYAALDEFAAAADVVTLEFEGVPIEAVQYLEKRVTVSPNSNALSICQNRSLEKQFLQKSGVPCAPFAVVESAEALNVALKRIGTPSVLKTACWGYDGKGQIKITDADADVKAIWKQLDAPSGVLEKWIPFKCECSAIVARNTENEVQVFPVAENDHENHILNISLVPARLSPFVQVKAQELARQLAEKLEVVGLLAVEFFVTESNELLVNEMAPRPHNSGHFSMDACLTSQFEQGIRAVCGLPLGSVDLSSPVAMLNLLGDLWQPDGAPNWDAVFRQPQCKLHLYDKKPPKVGRKMGHLNLLEASNEEALKKAIFMKQCLADGARAKITSEK